MKPSIWLAMTCFLLVEAVPGQYPPELIVEVFGSNAGDAFGESVTGIGDVNGDGMSDIAVGAPRNDSAGPDAGAVYVYSRISGQLLLTLLGDATVAPLGTSVAGAGDVDGDGVPDIIAGAVSFSPTGAYGGVPGTARVFSGATGAPIHTFLNPSPMARFGHAVAGLGDVDGDGFSDVAVSAPFANGGGGTMSGATYVYSGATGALLYTIGGNTAGGLLGWSLARVGDLNGDGVSDLIVGVPYFTYPPSTFNPSARVYSGATGATIYYLNDAPLGYREGLAANSAGDVDGDGLEDVIVSASFGTQPPSVRVYSGATGSVLHTFQNATSTTGFGHAVAAAGDVDMDGYGDVIISSPYDSSNGAYSGLIQVFSGLTGDLLFEGHGDSRDLLGYSLASVGDFDGDGDPDVVVGSRPTGSDIHAEGIARVYSFPAHLEPCAAGSVGVGAGGPYDVLVLNGSTGAPSRVVDLSLGTAFTLAMLQPPTNPFPAPFAVGAFIGLPGADEITPLPFGLGNACIPALPGYPGYFVLTNSFVPPPNGPVTSTPTPWSWSHPGPAFPFTITFQGVIQGTPALIQLTNAVALRVQ